jgi:signal transduction histidine kinase
MGGMVLLFGVMMFFTARRINTVRITSLQLRFENSGLVSYLTAEKEKSDKLNEKLLLEIRERERIEKELRKSEAHLRGLSTELLNAQERERKLIAQEIHDSLGASLAATKFKLEAALKEIGVDNPQASTALESIIPIVQGTIDEARRIQMSLRPSILDDLGILTTINWFCREFESTYLDIHIQKEIDIDEDEVPDSLKIVIYRVLQEAMNNIAKHSKANAVFLSLRKSGGSIELAIRDNGQGFDPAEAHSHTGTGRGLGLDSMRERVELSSGSYLIESKRGVGTLVRAFWLRSQTDRSS